MASLKHTLTILSLIILATSIAEAKSVYVISDTETSQLRAYKVDGANLVYQTGYVCESDPPESIGAVGLAIDESEYGKFLFVTFEDSDEIELVNATSMQYTDIVTAPGATNLAGIVADREKQKTYKISEFFV